MNFLTDLIWVGNTLYPRWFVFGIMAMIILLPITIGVAVRLVSRWT